MQNDLIKEKLEQLPDRILVTIYYKSVYDLKHNLVYPTGEYINWFNLLKLEIERR